MNAKNLPLKFGFVALLVAVSIWSLYGRGVRQGIDLRGGHSLVFEIRTNEMERNKLEREKKELAAQLERAGSEDQRDRLRQSIRTVEAEIERYEQAGADPSDLSERMIAILKNRIDPDGLLGTEWRPLGNNRFEVRIPAGSAELQAAGNAYFRELDALEQDNLEQSKIRRLIEAPASQREQMLKSLGHNDGQEMVCLRNVLESYRNMQQAQTDLEKKRKLRDDAAAEYTDAVKSEAPKEVQEQAKAKGDKADEDLKTAGKNLNKALEDHDKSRKEALRRGEIVLEDLQKDVLGYYVSPNEAAASRKEGHKVEVQRRRKLFEEKVDTVKGEYPGRKDEIDRVVEAYKNWANLRGHLDDPSDLKRLIAKAGVLEFRIVRFLPAPGRDFVVSEDELRQYKAYLEKEGPDGVRKRNGKYIWLPVHGEPEEGDYSGQPVWKHNDGRHYMLVCNQEGFTMLREQAGWKLTGAHPTLDDMNRPAVAFQFDEKGARLFAALTGAHKTHAMAIVLDDEVYSAPVIKERIFDRGIITGRFTREETGELARTLEAGSLPAKLNPNPVAENNFGPSMGEINLRMGLTAGYWSLIAVALFILFYYRVPGLIADVALLLNLVLILGAVSLMSAVLTLPGIAGVVLTIGMAVDANVLIFERLREEQAKGQSVRMALKNAYERAFSAIFDSNLTTLIICLILGWVGSEEVRGFAITLGLGVVISLFTALVVTRWIFQFLLDRRLISRPLSMMQLISSPKVNWVSKRYFFWCVSIFLMVVGVISVVSQGRGIMGIEFSSGTQELVKFKDDALIDGKLPNDALVERAFKDQAAKAGTAQAGELANTVRVVTRNAPNRVANFLKDYGKENQVKLADWRGNKRFFELVDKNGDGALAKQEMEERLPSAEYWVEATASDQESRKVISSTISSAFGQVLKTRQACEFRLGSGEDGEPAKLGAGKGGSLTFASLAGKSGSEVITKELLAKASTNDRAIMENFEGGILFVFSDVRPAITRVDLRDRVRDMRNAADFSEQRFNKTEVIGLTRAPGEGDECTAFAVLVKPAETVNPEQLLAKEKELIGLAFGREQAGETRNFDAAIAGEMTQRAIVAIVLGWLAIVAYLWFRFGSARWGLAAVICLIHDVTIVVGLIGVSYWLFDTFLGRVLAIEVFKIDLPMIAAVLMIIGYSVNDTIVVFDRIRENRGKLASVSYEVINKSINQTLSRTLLTSGTTLIVLVIMYVSGGPGIHPFGYALLIGVTFGTYSSIAIATPLLLGFKKALLVRAVAQPVPQEA